MAGCGALNCIVGSLRLPVVGRLGRLCLSACCLSLLMCVRCVIPTYIYLAYSSVFAGEEEHKRVRESESALCAKSEKSTKSQRVKQATTSWQQQQQSTSVATTGLPMTTPSATVCCCCSGSGNSVCLSLLLLVSSCLILLSARTAWRMRNVGVIHTLSHLTKSRLKFLQHLSGCM